MLDLNFYAWRHPTKDESGNDRLLVPMGDPNVHEFDFGFVFETEDQAIDALDDWGVFDTAKLEGWVLVHYTGTVNHTAIRQDLCDECRDPDHPTCPLDAACSCCRTTIVQMEDEDG